MTKEEWAEAVVWLDARYGDGHWTERRVSVYYADLEKFDAVDVWTAIHMYHEKGNTRTPTASQLIHGALDARRGRALEDQGRALPQPRDTMSWAEYCTVTYGEIISFTEAMEREHKKAGPCGIDSCSIHNPKQQPPPMRKATSASPW